MSERVMFDYIFKNLLYSSFFCATSISSFAVAIDGDHIDDLAPTGLEEWQQFPHCCCISYDTGRIGSGTVISRNAVLTAAHVSRNKDPERFQVKCFYKGYIYIAGVSRVYEYPQAAAVRTETDLGNDVPIHQDLSILIIYPPIPKGAFDSFPRLKEINIDEADFSVCGFGSGISFSRNKPISMRDCNKLLEGVTVFDMQRLILHNDEPVSICPTYLFRACHAKGADYHLEKDNYGTHLRISSDYFGPLPGDSGSALYDSENDIVGCCSKGLLSNKLRHITLEKSVGDDLEKFRKQFLQKDNTLSISLLEHDFYPFHLLKYKLVINAPKVILSSIFLSLLGTQLLGYSWSVMMTSTIISHTLYDLFPKFTISRQDCSTPNRIAREFNSRFSQEALDRRSKQMLDRIGDRTELMNIIDNKTLELGPSGATVTILQSKVAQPRDTPALFSCYYLPFTRDMIQWVDDILALERIEIGE